MCKSVLVHLCAFVGAVILYIYFLSGLNLTTDSCRQFYVIYSRNITIFDSQ